MGLGFALDGPAGGQHQVAARDPAGGVLDVCSLCATINTPPGSDATRTTGHRMVWV